MKNLLPESDEEVQTLRKSSFSARDATAGEEKTVMGRILHQLVPEAWGLGYTLPPWLLTSTLSTGMPSGCRASLLSPLPWSQRVEMGAKKEQIKLALWPEKAFGIRSLCLDQK